LEEILISSDISLQTSMDIVDELRDVVKENKIKDKDLVISELKQIIKNIFDNTPCDKVETPAVIMMIGVNGVGKTTTVGKLAKYFSNQKKSVTLAVADTFRAAAGDQLTIWAERAKVKVIKQQEGSDPSSVIYDAVDSAKARKTDVLIIDTAGRLHNKVNLMEELKKMARVVEKNYPEANFYKFIVLDATTGQNAVQQAKLFDEAVGIDSVVLTKLDGTAKGGFVVSLCNDADIPVSFVGTGEKIDDIEEFDGDDFVEALF
ncbi:MAG: signal recognition particle-docking protein FtsY, partial [Clostridia bacterium]|nr:signal recognition particle-docking protein FtsY [Clostridia bacterium]